MMKICITLICLLSVLSASAVAEDAPQQQWESRYEGMGNFDDYARAITTDASGNVYVTGRSTGINSYDFITIKYDQTGNQLWSARFDNPAHGSDDPSAIAVDNSGNVYVTGHRVSGIAQYYYATVKYDPNGNQLWVSYYSGTSTKNNSAKAIAVDNSGNVYVTGVSWASGTGNDFATVKYDPNGNQLWAAKYNGPPGNGYDVAEAITLDSLCNVYVTGESRGLVSNYDYATIKYNSTGQQQWVARYNGDGNLADYAYTIAVDSFHNVYVGGRSTGVGTYYDYATIKYNPDGNQLWATRYNGPSNSNDRIYMLTLDSSANVYVTGESNGIGSGLDYATIKYSSVGAQLWVSQYNGPGNNSDVALAVALDGSGNTYVTGRSIGIDYDYATVKYAPDGNQLWVSRYNGPANGSDTGYALTLRGSNLYVTGNSADPNTYQDYATIKYDLNGNQIWLARFNGEAHISDMAGSVAVDETGNVYVTGVAAGDTNSYDYTTIKYDLSGSQMWVAAYNGPSDNTDMARALSVDGAGNVYVTGNSYGGSVTKDDYATVKYDPNGDQLWAARYNSPANSGDVACDLAVDDSGNVYITGYSGSGTGDDYATVKYDPNGGQMWVARYNGSSNSTDGAAALAVDNSGNVYVTGASYSSTTRSDYATIKYDSNGSQIWTAFFYGSTASSDDQAKDIAVDSSGNVYVTGFSDYDYATVKYNATGDQLWAARYNGLGSDNDRAFKLVLDDSCNVYVTGVSTGSGTNYDYATIKYLSDGNQLWVARYNSPTNASDEAETLAVDHFGNVYVTGVSDENYVTIKYDPNGNQLWLMTYNGPGNDHDSAWALASDDYGSIYVTGESASALGDYDYATIKYTQHDYCFEPLTGDYTGDCKVEFTDFAVLANAWLIGYDLFDLDTLARNWLICNFALEEDCW